MNPIIFSAAILIFPFIIGCTQGDNNTENEKTENSSSFVGDSSFSKSSSWSNSMPKYMIDTECQSIAYGAKACGGPKEYLIYSTKNSDITEIQPLANKYNNYEQQNNIETGAVSDCMFVTAPELECIEKLCNVSVSSSSSSEEIECPSGSSSSVNIIYCGEYACFDEDGYPHSVPSSYCSN